MTGWQDSVQDWMLFLFYFIWTTNLSRKHSATMQLLRGYNSLPYIRYSMLQNVYLFSWFNPLITYFHVLLSRRRFRCIKSKMVRFSRNVVPVAIRMLNKWYWCQRICFLCGYILNWIWILWQSFFLNYF